MEDVASNTGRGLLTMDYYEIGGKVDIFHGWITKTSFVLESDDILVDWLMLQTVQH